MCVGLCLAKVYMVKTDGFASSFLLAGSEIRIGLGLPSMYKDKVMDLVTECPPSPGSQSVST